MNFNNDKECVLKCFSWVISIVRLTFSLGCCLSMDRQSVDIDDMGMVIVSFTFVFIGILPRSTSKM